MTAQIEKQFETIIGLEKISSYIYGYLHNPESILEIQALEIMAGDVLDSEGLN